MEYTIFGAHFGHRLEALREVWRRSIEANCPTASIEIERIPYPPDVKNVMRSAPDNMGKLAAWRRRLQRAEQPILFMDIDTYARQDLEPVWDAIGDADVGYTWRPLEHRPIVGGFIPARPTEGARRFFTEWLIRASELMMNPVDLFDNMVVRGGLLQTCLTELTQDPPDGVKVQELSPYVWNSCDETWKDFDPDVCRMVHCKGDLRHAILACDRKGEYGELVREWRSYLFGDAA